MPKVLQGGLVSPSSTQETVTPGFETGSSGKKGTKENPKDTKISIEDLEASVSTPLGPQAKAQLEASLKRGQETLPSTLDKSVTNTTKQQPSTEIGNPIISLTPLQSSFGNPSSEVIFIDDLTPISAEEMPPSDFFFSKKRRAIVKRETHQKDGAIVKRQRMVYDGQGRDDSDFAKEMVGSLGAFATTNQWSVENLVEQLKQRNQLVEQLQKQILTTE